MLKSFVAIGVLAVSVVLCIGVAGKWRTEMDRIDAEYHQRVARIQVEHRERLAQIARDYSTEVDQPQSGDMMTRNVEKLLNAALREIERARASITSTGCNKPAVVTRAFSAIIEFDGVINGGVLDSRVQAAIGAHVGGVVVKTENINFVNNVLTVIMSITFPLAG
jgi:hypothetical protein